MQTHRAYFEALAPGLLVFGEWCGPGVEKGMAISQARKKVFAVFAVRVEGAIVYEPDAVRARLPAAGAPEDLFVRPWEGAPITLDYGSRASLDAAVLELNARDVEREDPVGQAHVRHRGPGRGPGRWA